MALGAGLSTGGIPTRSLRAARILADERDSVAIPHGAVERMREAQDGVVDQDFDVFRQFTAARIPQSLSECGMTIAHLTEHAAHAGVRRHRLLEHLSPRSIAADEPRNPRHDLDGDVTDCGLRITDYGIARGHRRVYAPHRDGIRNSSPSARSVSGRGRPVFRS